MNDKDFWTRCDTEVYVETSLKWNEERLENHLYYYIYIYTPTEGEVDFYELMSAVELMSWVRHHRAHGYLPVVHTYAMGVIRDD